MANTTNLNMVKPAGTDHALISVINSNMDIIDGAVGALPSGSTLQGEIDSANTAIGNITNNVLSGLKLKTYQVVFSTPGGTTTSDDLPIANIPNNQPIKDAVFIAGFVWEYGVPLSAITRNYSKTVLSAHFNSIQTANTHNVTLLVIY